MQGSKKHSKIVQGLAQELPPASYKTTQSSDKIAKRNGELQTNSEKILKGQSQAEYKNEFMNIPLLDNAEVLTKAPSTKEKQKYLKKSKDHQSLEIKKRTKTEGKEDEPQEKRSTKKYSSFLPQLHTNPLPQIDQNSKERNLKLKELYEKKSKLYKKLQFINKKLINTKIESQIEFSNISAIDQNSIINTQAKSKSKSYSNSRNTNYLNGMQMKRLLENKKKKDNSPESMISPEKNREVISFIQKMHEQTVRRDLNRYTRSQKAMENQLSHVCLECTRSKCQAGAIDRILKDSRLI